MPAKKLPYMAFFTSDYVRDTRILSLEARAVWMDMLCLMHDGDRPGYLSRAGTPLSVDQVARFSGCPADTAQRAIDEIIAAGVASRDDNGIIYSRRILRDDNKRRDSVKSGRKGGNPKVLLMVNGGVNPTVNPRVNPTPNPTDKARLGMEDGNGIGIGVGSSPAEEGCGGKGRDLVADFAAFWSAYPRKMQKSMAAESWAKLNPDDALVATILAAIEQQKRSEQWTKDNGRYIPHASTWLNQSRWTDELPPPAPPGESVPPRGPPLSTLAAKIKQDQDEQRRRETGGQTP